MNVEVVGGRLSDDESPEPSSYASPHSSLTTMSNPPASCTALCHSNPGHFNIVPAAAGLSLGLKRISGGLGVGPFAGKTVDLAHARWAPHPDLGAEQMQAEQRVTFIWACVASQQLWRIRGGRVEARSQAGTWVVPLHR